MNYPNSPKILKNNIPKIKIISIVFLLTTTIFMPVLSGEYQEKNFDYKNPGEKTIEFADNPDGINLSYVYNIIRDLSYIIFTEYNESAGELAKGRVFGSKGEHKAAQILYDNMTELGLITEKERIQNTENYPELTHAYQILDRDLTLWHNDESEKPDFFISAEKIERPVHEEIKTFNHTGLKIKKYPSNPSEWIKAIISDKKEGKYVFLSDGMRDVLCRDPNASLSNASLPLDIRLVRKFLYPICNPSVLYAVIRRKIKTSFLEKAFPNCEGIIMYQTKDDFHDTAVGGGLRQPKIVVNGSVGDRILSDIDNYRVDFNITEMYNESLESYNVIGLLEGTNKDKTVIVDCLYDSVWCQGTGDSAIGMGIVMGVAKYFNEHNITPKCNIKFCGFGGEEAGLRGVKYYVDTHNDEKVTHVIDMNQVCSNQEWPRLTLNVICNKLTFANEIWPIIEESNYTQRVGIKDIAKRWWPLGAPSDDRAFTWDRKDKNLNIKTVCFLEDFPWIAHHKDGMNHTKGDVFENVNWKEVVVLGEIVIKIVEHLTVET